MATMATTRRDERGVVGDGCVNEMNERREKRRKKKKKVADGRGDVVNEEQ